MTCRNCETGGHPDYCSEVCKQSWDDTTEVIRTLNPNLAKTYKIYYMWNGYPVCTHEEIIGEAEKKKALENLSRKEFHCWAVEQK